MSSSPSHVVSRPFFESRLLSAIFLVSLTVPVYFLLLGYFGDDYGFHLASWVGVLEGWRSGLLLPAWFAQANFGLGEPRFYFYPPVTAVFGAFFLFVFPARIVPGLMPWLAMVAAGLSMGKLGRYLQPGSATRSALLYCTSYYMVVTIVMRYAIGEVFVAALLPLIVLYATQFFFADGPLNRRFISVSFTLLLAFTWLTNIPAALVVFYILLFGSALLSVVRRSVRPLLVYLLAQALAAGLAAWYLVPAALAHSQLTATSLAAKFPWRDYTLFHHPHNPLARSMTWPLWIWAIVGFVCVLSSALRRFRTPGLKQSTAPQWLLVASFGCFPMLFELPQSGLLWNGLPAVKLVAFSVRFLPFVAIALSLLVPNIRSASLRRAAYSLWIVWMLLPVAERIGRSHVHGTPPPFSASAAEIDRGIGGMSEYLPAGIDIQPETAVAAASLAQSPASACSATSIHAAPQDRQFLTHSSQPCLFEPGLFYFPEWLAKVDGRPFPVQRSQKGLVQLQLPPGDHRIEVYFHRPRKPLWLGLGITLLSLALLSVATLSSRGLRPLIEKTTSSSASEALMP